MANLTRTMESEEMEFKELQRKLQDTLNSLGNEEEEEYGMSLGYNEEIRSKLRKMLEETNMTMIEHGKFKRKIDSEMEKLEQREKELEKREAEYENERRKVRRLKKMNELERKVLKLAEDHKRGDEAIEKHIAELGKHIVQKHEVELQVVELRKSAEEVELMGMDTKTRIAMDAIEQKLEDTEEKLEHIAALTGLLIAKERECNDELQEAQQELISGWENNKKDLDASIAVRSMGVFHESVFLAAARELYPRKDATAKARELISQWNTYIRDPEWHPFKICQENGVFKEVIVIEDERLQALREELGEEACSSVITTLNELNEYNPNGRYPVLELWNFSAQRKASLKEGAEFLLKDVLHIKGKNSQG